MKRWYVVHTLTHREAWAETNLQRQGFSPWLPCVLQVRRHSRRVETVIAPLFPSYLFIELDVEVQRWRSVNGTFGVLRLLCHGDRPLPAPTGLVEKMMQRQDGSGVIDLPPRQFVEGESLRLAEGPFSEAEGLFAEMSGQDRVVILLNLMGRPVRATVPIRSIRHP